MSIWKIMIKFLIQNFVFVVSEKCFFFLIDFHEDHKLNIVYAILHCRLHTTKYELLDLIWYPKQWFYWFRYRICFFFSFCLTHTYRLLNVKNNEREREMIMIKKKMKIINVQYLFFGCLLLFDYKRKKKKYKVFLYSFNILLIDDLILL